MIALRQSTARVIPFRQVAELYGEPPCLNGIEPPIVALYVVVVLFHLTMVADHLHCLRHSLIVGCDRAAFATSPKILSWVETESRCVAHGTCLLPVAVFLREILGAMCLACVLNHN